MGYSVVNGVLVADENGHESVWFRVPQEFRSAETVKRIADTFNLELPDCCNDRPSSYCLSIWGNTQTLHATDEGEEVPWESVLAAIGVEIFVTDFRPEYLRPGMRVRLRNDLREGLGYGVQQWVGEMLRGQDVTIRAVSSWGCNIEEGEYRYTPEMFAGIYLTEQDMVRDFNLSDLRPGTKVKVRSDLVNEAEYGPNCWVNGMQSGIVTVSGIGLDCFSIEEDRGLYVYTLEMCEGYFPEVPASHNPKDTRGKPKLNPLLKKFALADTLTARSMIRCGFELETQSSNGYTWDDCADSEPDWDRARELARDSVNDTDAYDLVKNYGDSEGFFSQLSWSQFNKVTQALFNTTSPSLEQLAEYDRTIDVDDILDSAIDAETEHIMDNWRDYFDPDEGDPSNVLRIPKGMTVMDDGSIRGFEFITEGAKTYPEFVRCANDVFKMDHEIDVGCSFHIHLSVPGIRPKRGDHMVRRLTQYIIDHQNELPESVRQRFQQVKKGPGRFYAPYGESRGKSGFINHHDQGTWEFRCFGNVQSAAEAKACLDLAIRALRWAYRVRFEMESDPLNLTLERWRESASSAMVAGTTVKQAAIVLGYLAPDERSEAA